MTNTINQSEFIALQAFDNEDDSMLDAMHSMSSENDFNYFQKCVSSLESRDSEVNLSPDSVSVSSPELRLENLEDHYKNANGDMHNVDLRFMKGENVFLDSKKRDEEHSKQKEQDSASEIDSDVSLTIHKESNGILEFGMNPDNVINYHHLGASPMAHNFENFADSKFLEEPPDKSSTLQDYAVIDTSNVSHFESKHVDSESETKETYVANEFKFENESIIETNNMNENNDLESKVCPQCPMTFKYKRHFDRHIEGHEKNNCFHCNAKFARRKHLDVHLFRTHGERSNNRYPHFCETCLRNFPKKTLLSRHRAKHHLESGEACLECGDITKSDADIEEHKLRHEKEKHFKCTRCSQSFSTEQTFQSHMQNHDNYKCSECEASFASKKAASRHFRIAHSNKFKDVKPISDGHYFCTDCRLSFMKKSGYCRHLETAMHLNKVNQPVSPKASFTCPVCTKALTTRQACVQHIRRVHRGEKKFACDTPSCSFQCAYKNDLDRHKQLHVEERNFVCEYCGKAFTSISILKDHILYIHNKERQFVCEECGKSFKRNSLLNRHKLSHQQFRPYACEKCTAAFKRSHHLSRHMESCHRLTMEKKRKLVKLMKTEDGKLIPVPEKFEKVRVQQDSGTKFRTETKSNSETGSSSNQNLLDNQVCMQTQTSSNSHSFVESTNVSTEISNNLLQTDSVSQVVSLVDINLGEVVTVEDTNQDSLPIDDIVSQFDESCNEILDLPSYHDLEFHHEILNRDGNYYDSAGYSEMHLEDVDESSLLLASSDTKIDSLPIIDNYLTQTFPSFLNL